MEWGRSHDEAEAAPVTEALAIDVWLWGEITADVGSPSCGIGLWAIGLSSWCTGLRATGSSSCCTGLRAFGCPLAVPACEPSDRPLAVQACEPLGRPLAVLVCVPSVRPLAVLARELTGSVRRLRLGVAGMRQRAMAASGRRAERRSPWTVYIFAGGSEDRETAALWRRRPRPTASRLVRRHDCSPGQVQDKLNKIAPDDMETITDRILEVGVNSPHGSRLSSPSS